MKPRAPRSGALTILLALALCACQFGQPDPLAELEPAAKLPPTNGTYLNMGRQLLASNQPDLAQDAFIRSLRTEGVTAAALTGAGLASERQGLMHDARRYFEHAVRLAPNSVIAQNNLGVVLYRMGDYQAARRAFQTAFALSSGTSRIAEQNLGMTDMALARAEGRELPMSPNPVPLQRLGTGEYIIGTPTNAEQSG